MDEIKTKAGHVVGSWDGKKWDITKGWESGCGKAGKPSKEKRMRSRKADSGKNKNLGRGDHLTKQTSLYLCRKSS